VTPAEWVPRFADYLTLAFWTATAFSPTDVSAVKRWAISRAINILK
jgi:hypothetical protein